jgi:hypothetical protein
LASLVCGVVPYQVLLTIAMIFSLFVFYEVRPSLLL